MNVVRICAVRKAPCEIHEVEVPAALEAATMKSLAKKWETVFVLRRYYNFKHPGVRS